MVAHRRALGNKFLGERISRDGRMAEERKGVDRRTVLGGATALAGTMIASGAKAQAPAYRRIACEEGFLSPGVLAQNAKASTPTMPVYTDLASDVQPLVLGRATAVRIAVLPLDHVFRAGSRIRVVIDTASQTGGWNFEPLVNAGLVSVLHDTAHPSQVVFGTVRGASAPRSYPACDTLLNQPCRPDAFPSSRPSGRLG